MATTNRSRNAMLENLESRTLLSATLDQGELLVIGTKKNDYISIIIEASTPDQVTVTVNKDVRRFLRNAIEKINVQAGQGDDVIFMNDRDARLNFPTRLYGSGGNDTIHGASGRDRIYGGRGDDVLSGWGNRDVIYGESGNDELDGGLGNDYIDGAEGNDTITGGAGIDYLFGGSGNDLFGAKDGFADSVDGGDGVDLAKIDIFDGRSDIEVFLTRSR